MHYSTHVTERKCKNSLKCAKEFDAYKGIWLSFNVIYHHFEINLVMGYAGTRILW